MGASSFQTIYFVTIWESLPQTIIGIRQAFSLVTVIIIVTEMFIGTTAGLGKKIIDFQIMYQTENMYAAIVLAGVIGYLINVSIVRIERRIVHWK